MKKVEFSTRLQTEACNRRVTRTLEKRRRREVTKMAMGTLPWAGMVQLRPGLQPWSSIWARVWAGWRMRTFRQRQCQRKVCCCHSALLYDVARAWTPGQNSVSRSFVLPAKVALAQTCDNGDLAHRLHAAVGS